MQNVGDPIRQLARQNPGAERQFGQNRTNCLEIGEKLVIPASPSPFERSSCLPPVRFFLPILCLRTALLREGEACVYGLGDRMSAWERSEENRLKTDKNRPNRQIGGGNGSYNWSDRGIGGCQMKSA